MEVGDSAFTNDDDADSHVVVRPDVDINNEVEDEDGEKRQDETVGLRQSPGATVCLVDAGPDTFPGSVPFLAADSPSVQFIDASNGSDSSSSVLKTTHIVIHKHSLKGGLVSPVTPLPPPTPATPSARERGYRYKWDDSAFYPVIPVRCKSSNGDLHKAKFGSGILFDLCYQVLNTVGFVDKSRKYLTSCLAQATCVSDMVSCTIFPIKENCRHMTYIEI